MNRSQSGCVAIFGATSRVGHALALEYARSGQSVFLAARDVVEAERIANDVSVRTGAQTHFDRFDALDYTSHQPLIQRIEERFGALDTAILAFGDMGCHESSMTDFEAARRVLDVNYTAAVSLCEAIATIFETRKSGSIIGLSSVAGERGRQSNYFYGSAKGALTLYLQGLAHRLARSEVHVMTVKLGFIDTRMTYGLETAIPIAKPEAAAKAVIRAQSKGRTLMYYPAFWKPVMGLIRALPSRIMHRTKL